MLEFLCVHLYLDFLKLNIDLNLNYKLKLKLGNKIEKKNMN